MKRLFPELVMREQLWKNKRRLPAIIAQIVHPDLGAAYLGTQGDIWDAQKDMMAAIVGGILATLAISAVVKRRG